MITTLNQLIQGNANSQVYLLQTDKLLEDIKRAIEVAHLAFFYIDGSKVTDKTTFFLHTKIGLNLPDYFGMNYDALNDCLMDFSWHPAKGYVILYDNFDQFATHSLDDFLISVRVMDGAAREGEGKMYILLKGDDRKLLKGLESIDIVHY